MSASGAAKPADAIFIAPAGAGDMETVAALFREYQQGLGVDLCFQGFAEELAGLPGDYAPPSGALLVARRAGEAVGVVALRPLEPGIAEMKRLYVRPTVRGARLGRRLAVAILDEARRRGYRAVRLDTLHDMTAAHALYEALGFRRIAAYNDNPLDGVRFYELALAGAGETAP
jgi:ribosomal protein S18 acetylase RimI-like enzyme